MYELICLAIITAIVTYVIVRLMTSSNGGGRNFEREMQMRFASDPAYVAQFQADPRGSLEKALSDYKGAPFRFSPGVNVRVMQQDDNDLYVLLPRVTAVQRSPLDRIVSFLNEPRTYGLFMGSLEGIWWRMGLDSGSCMSDIWAEVDAVKRHRPLHC